MSRVFATLTRSAMRKLARGKEITEQGITFTRLGNGDGVFTINIMVDGQRIHRAIGRESDGTTRTQAEEFISKVRNDAREDRLALPKGRKVPLSFREAALKYLERLAGEGGRDLKTKRSRLMQHLIPFLGDTPLTNVTTSHIERYKQERRLELAIRGGEKQRPKDERRLRTTSPGTINRELAIVSHLRNKAMEWGWIDRCPARIKRFPEEGARLVHLTAEQAARLVECAQADTNPQIYPFVLIGLHTAMRCMEILSLRREHVNLERGMLYIPQAKAGGREQPITAHLVDFLAGHIALLPEETPWLFPSAAAKGGHTVNVRKAFRRIVEAAGLNPDQVVSATHCAIRPLRTSFRPASTCQPSSGFRATRR